MSDDARGMLGPHPEPGERVGGYQLVRLLGSGGMAAVYLGHHASGAPAAVKILSPDRVLPEEVKRFAREYQALEQLDHPNVVRVQAAGVHRGYPWLAMEYVDGTDLGTLIERWQTRAPADRYGAIEHLLRGMCRGLQYIHDQGLIHRDIKPSNILITRDGEAKLSDFGVVKRDGSSGQHTQLTMAGRLVGTVAFMAPELITSEGVDRRTDLYALGAVLYLMLTFRRPIEAQSVAGYLARHLTEVPRPAGEVDPQVPRRLENIAQRLLLKDKTYRFPTAQAVLQALDRPDGADAPPLRGRDDELAAFGRRLQALVEGAGGSLAIVAAPGGGRTHLLEAFLDQVGDRGIPLHRVPEVVSYDGLGDLIRGGPRVVAVDDLDRAALPDVTLLARLLRERVTIEGEPLLLVYTAAELDGDLAPLASGSATGIPSERMDLGPIDPRSTIAMMRDRGIVGPAAPLLGRRLHADYAGRPGPMVEQLEALIAAGWMESSGDALRPARPLESLRRDDLPVPPAAQVAIEARLERLDRDASLITEVLALLDRPASGSLLARCAPEIPDPGRVVDALVQARILLQTDNEDRQEVLQFTHPCASRVIRSRLGPRERRARHAAIAEALAAHRRRASAAEVARHHELAGNRPKAYPLYIQAAKRAARDLLFSEVLEHTTRAEELRPHAEPLIDDDEATRLARWLHLLRGEALLARGNWSEAARWLAEAVAAARLEGDPAGLARCLSSEGRAHYRNGSFDTATPLLQESLERAGPGAAERVTALRALADIDLRRGNTASAERRWFEALDIAIGMGSRDAEARARRGLAHTRGIQGRLQEASELLDQAEELLNPEGDPRVRAGVLARAIEIDAAAGRFGAALRKAELLVDLDRRRELSERLPEAYALLADTLCVLGAAEEAHDAAQQALIFAKAHGSRTWDARLRAARVLCAIGRPAEEVQAALPRPEDLPANLVDDPAAQLAALRARVLGSSNPAKARDLATWAVLRDPPLYVIRTARIALDASIALAAAGQVPAARSAVKRGLKALEGPGADGLRLELLVAMERAQPDDRVLLAAGQVARRVVANLSPAQAGTFCGREIVRRALERAGE